jgi:hypothetical protein
MALTIRKGSDTALFALATALNALRADATLLGARFHADITAGATTGDFTVPATSSLTVSAANATDLPTSITLANQIKAFFNIQIADALAHKTADATNKIVAANAVDLATTQTLANAIKAAFNAHLTQATVHYTNDATNTNATAAATDLPTSIALLNALKGNINAHIVSAPAGYSVNLVSA